MEQRLHPLSVERTQQIFEERARLLARQPETVDDGEEILELATFRLGAESIGLPSAWVYETQPLRAFQWTPIPCTPPFIVGILNLRGHLYSIMDLARFWGLPARPLTDRVHVLRVCGGVCEDGEPMELTLLADDAPHLCKIPLTDLSPPPATLPPQMQDSVRGVSPELLIVLDLERLLSDPGLIVQEEP